MVTAQVLFKEVGQGKSIGRILINEALSQWRDEVKGVVLDLACGSNPSYRRFLDLTKKTSVYLVGVDHYPTCFPTIVADLTCSLPFKSKTVEAVILANFLNIPPDPARILSEVYRVLKEGGLLLLSVSFVFPYNPEPTDHWRFTAEALRLLLRQSGFTEVAVVPIGERWTAAAYLLSPFLRPRWLVAPLVYWACLRLDDWTKMRFKGLAPCPIAYVVKARSTL